MNEKQYETVVEFVASQIGEDNSGHGLAHAKRVKENALAIAKEEGGDEDVIVLASLLHDTADHKLFSDTGKQLEKMKAILLENGFTAEVARHVAEIAATISWNKGQQKELNSLEAKIVRDADRLDAIGAVGIVRTIEYGNSHGRPFYTQEEIDSGIHDDSITTLAHFYQKLLLLEDHMCTKAGKELAHDRSEFMKTFLDEFYLEIGASSK